jgi:hypothetical protein
VLQLRLNPGFEDRVLGFVGGDGLISHGDGSGKGG